MAGCQVDPSCVAWETPKLLLCDPCIDLGNPEHQALWQQAWQTVTSFLYDVTGRCWPGACFTETIRPCLDRPSCPSSRLCDCSWCGIYNSLPLTGTCLPVIDVCEVWVGADCCYPEPRIWTGNGGGVRLERGPAGPPRLVIEDGDGCCGTWPRQDLCRPTGTDHTWHVTVRTGCPPPAYVLHGAVEMTNELVKGCVVNGCRLPGSITSMSFDGTTIQMDPDQPVSLPLQMLQRVLDRAESDAPIVESFTAPTPWQMHHVDGPVRVESCCVPCGAVCPSRAACGTDTACDCADALAAHVGGVLV